MFTRKDTGTVAENDNMGELGTRWIVAGLVTCAAGWFGTPNFLFATIVAVGWAIASTILLRLNRENPGNAGFVAALDSLGIALLLSGASRLGTFGWVAGLPAAYAVVRYRSQALPTASLVAGMVLAAHFAVQQKLPSGLLCLQLAGILFLGVVMRPQAVAEETESIGPIDPLGAHDPDSLLGLRESFRQLKTLYRNLQWKSRRDRIVAGLMEARLGDDSEMVFRLAEHVRELTGATSARIYSVCQNPKGFASTEDFLRIDPEDAVGRIRHKADQLTSSLGGTAINVPLVSELGVVGLCSLTAEPAMIDDIRQSADELAPILGGLIHEAQQRQYRKQNEAVDALRLECLARTRGSSGPKEVAARTADALFGAFSLSHLTICHVGEELVTKGLALPHREWTSIREDIVAPDAANHPALPNHEVTRLRVGSLLSIRIGLVQIVAAAREGVLNLTVADQLRAIAADLDWRFDGSKAEGGLVSAEAFRLRMGEQGVLVLFETTDRDTRSRTDRESGTTAIQLRALNMLPSRGAVLVRDDGDVLVHLPGVKLAEASGWAQRVANGQSGIRVRTASLWQPTNAVISHEETEPEALFAQSMN